jgi:polyferredoxin
MQGQFYNLHVEHRPTRKQRPYTIIMCLIMEAASMTCVTYAAVRKSDHFFFNFFLILVDDFVMIFLGVLFDKVMCGFSVFFTFLALFVLVCWQSTKRRRSLVDLRTRLEIKCNQLIDKLVCGDAAKEEAEKKDRKNKLKKKDRKNKLKKKDKESKLKT